ncbi:MAG TPA: large conductance mechanosensitive channel protein MscL [Clostridiales bacterium]|nr:large conductance mechanosensitive channel protein MscL [Clostridiales bacterium]HBE12901.1 large conductance mechanosensitive channel protein MscL [Clostridiales bacterium]HCG36035.1 large conductance mechanosensitive channel protein MscL [Clostridiales bacterium]
MTKKGRSFLKEFKTFIARGNVLDLAVAVVIGTAFNKIVTSFVNDLIMPALCLLTGKASFADLKWCVKEAITLTEDGEVLDQSTYIIYGAFLQAVIDFLLIAFSVFIMIKVVNNVRKKLEQVTEALPGLKKSPEEIAAEEAALAAAAAEAATKAEAEQAALEKAAAVQNAEIAAAETLHEIRELITIISKQSRG